MHNGEAVLRRWFDEVWTKGRIELIDEMLADDYHTRGLKDGKSAASSVETMKAWRQQFAREFPVLRIEIQDVVADGDRAALRCQVHVTQANTGKTAEFAGMCFAHIKGGKISQAWNSFDFADMRRQLG